MQRTDEAGRAAPLVLELASGTARRHGEELELPRREFRLLAALAARVGNPVPPEDLIKAVWPDAPWTSTNDLYTLVSKLRRLIDGPDKFGNNIRNRRGFGYFLDLSPDDLMVIDQVPVEPTPITVDPTIEDEEVVSKIVAEPREVEEAQTAPAVVPRRSPVRTAAVVALVVVLLAGSWGAGYVLSRRNSERAESRGDSVASHPEVPEKTDAKKTKKTRHAGPNRASKRQDRKGHERNSGPAAAGVPGSTAPVAAAPPPSGSASGSTSGSRKGSDNTKEPAAPPLPAAPTRYLYHLQHPETGDHFVTTDDNIVSTYEGRGYVGGAIGRVYTSAPSGVATKAITTNRGTGYIFSNSSEKTEPASSFLPLYYSTNNDGDFFYTTSADEAEQTGWDGVRIGYVRTVG